MFFLVLVPGLFACAAAPAESPETRERLAGLEQGFRQAVEKASAEALPEKGLPAEMDPSAARLQRLQPLFDTYQEALATLAGELGKAGKVDDAAAVRDLSRDLARSRTIGNAGAVSAITGKPTRVRGAVRSFANSLDMTFVPVPGARVLFCVHETRRQDYAAFVAAIPGRDEQWQKPERAGVAIGSGGGDEPVVLVNWEDAAAFCAWLGRREGHTYRLPADREWSLAMGMEAGTGGTASGTVYPWGDAWPPPPGSGNYQDEACKGLFPKTKAIAGYNDGYATLAPVMSFKPDARGLYDLSGNVWEWCEDWDSKHICRVSRGGSWSSKNLLSSARHPQHPLSRTADVGFRCVMEMDR